MSNEEIKEYGDYKLGDHVYTHLLNNVDIGYGKIRSFHLNSKMGPAFSFWDEINGGIRTTLIENVIIDPSPKIKRKLVRSRRKSNKR